MTLHSNGQYVAANPLHPTAMATSVQVRNGKRLVTDGPFAETREQLGGYFLIDAKNLDEALAIAARIPMARKGTVEVRPIIELPDFRHSRYCIAMLLRSDTGRCRFRGCRTTKDVGRK